MLGATGSAPLFYIWSCPSSFSPPISTLYMYVPSPCVPLLPFPVFPLPITPPPTPSLYVPSPCASLLHPSCMFPSCTSLTVIFMRSLLPLRSHLHPPLLPMCPSSALSLYVPLLYLSHSDIHEIIVTIEESPSPSPPPHGPSSTLSLYVPLLYLSYSDTHEIIVIIVGIPSAVNSPVKERYFWFTSHSISEPTSINVYNATCVDVISTPLLKRQAVCAGVL